MWPAFLPPPPVLNFQTEDGSTMSSSSFFRPYLQYREKKNNIKMAFVHLHFRYFELPSKLPSDAEKSFYFKILIHIYPSNFYLHTYFSIYKNGCSIFTNLSSFAQTHREKCCRSDRQGMSNIETRIEQHLGGLVNSSRSSS